ncbi:MAG: hypothetical protein IPL83_00910 [Bdellovibrionales bacterium]|nr:hypothetical protein [Bdellovibrionales bacterium]
MLVSFVPISRTLFEDFEAERETVIFVGLSGLVGLTLGLGEMGGRETVEPIIAIAAVDL